MCKYCNDMWEEMECSSEYNLFAFIDFNPYIDGVAIAVGCVEPEDAGIKCEIKINYCPMCGRKLEK